MIKKLKILVTVCMLVILLPVIGFFLIIDTKPHIERQVTVTPKHIERAKVTFDQHRQNTQKIHPATLSISPADLDIAATYLAKHFTNGQSRISIGYQKAKIQASLPLPIEAIKGYINLEARLIETNSLPQLQSVRIGHIPIPDFISRFLITQSIHWLQSQSQYRKVFEAIGLVQFVQFTPDKLHIRYQWKGGLKRLDNYFPVLSKSEQEKVHCYYQLLVQNNQEQKKQTLPQILQLLMQTAIQKASYSSAQKENRAAILAATFYVLALPINYLIPEAPSLTLSQQKTITLDGRKDFAQHFIVSAAITAYADTALSDAIGLYKEIEDKRSGSGFSFNDIAADRAGTRFGERATATRHEAMRLQHLIAQGLDDKKIMPAWTDLPEHLSTTEFRQHYGTFDTPAFHQIIDKIERRVEALPFLH